MPLIRREDDTKEVILARLKAYHDATGPVIAYYSNGGCRRVDATGTPAEISREIERLLMGHATGSLAGENGFPTTATELQQQR
jgi:hypothetical protein